MRAEDTRSLDTLPVPSAHPSGLTAPRELCNPHPPLPRYATNTSREVRKERCRAGLPGPSRWNELHQGLEAPERPTGTGATPQGRRTATALLPEMPVAALCLPVSVHSAVNLPR